MSSEFDSSEKEVQDHVERVSLEEELKTAYLGYAMSVIVGRALPDIRDGLKPVQRRILYAMHELANHHQRPHKKSGRIVGDVLGKYHPHGDAAIYEALVRMAQDFSLRCPLVDGQGNFGSVDGDPPAHMRYTEVRLKPLSQALLKDLEKETVDFLPNYDGSEKMPSVLPAAFPNLLVNGSAGIAVGMATNIPPHNLGEALKGVIALLENPDLKVEELMEHIPGPDFPTGGIIMGTEGILEAYRTGRGKIVIRARASVEQVKDREKIIVHELPYQVNKSKLLESIAELVKDKKLEGISEIRDESDREGLRVVFELKRHVSGESLLHQMYRLTALQQAFAVNMVVLSLGKPVQANLKEVLEAFLSHRRSVIVRRSRFERDKVRARLHLLHGLLRALNELEPCIELIRAASNTAEAKQWLKERTWKPLEGFQLADPTLSEEQAQAILDLRLNKLTSLESANLLKEAKEAEEQCRALELILADPERLKQVVREELQGLLSLSDPRRTEIQHELGYSEQTLVPEMTVVVTLSQKGYIKYQNLSEYTAQHRGGRGKVATSLRAEDLGESCLVVSTHDRLLCFSSRGRVYWLEVHQLPCAGRGARGKPIINLLPLIEGEKITTILPLERGSSHPYVVLATSQGMVKKIELAALQTARQLGVVAATLQPGDSLVGAEFTEGEESIFLFTEGGQVVRFHEKQVRSMGRSASGVKGISLAQGDKVVSLMVPKPGGTVLTVTEHGFGKRTTLEAYPEKSRATKGVISIKVNQRNGKVIGALQVFEGEEVVLLTHQGILLRLSVDEISCIGRNTQGVVLLRLEPNDRLVSLQRLLADAKEQVVGEQQAEEGKP